MGIKKDNIEVEVSGVEFAEAMNELLGWLVCLIYLPRISFNVVKPMPLGESVILWEYGTRGFSTSLILKKLCKELPWS